MAYLVCRVVTPFVAANGHPQKEGGRLTLTKEKYRAMRGLDYIARLCVRDEFQGRSYLRFIEVLEGKVRGPEGKEILVYASGCCVSPKPDSVPYRDRATEQERQKHALALYAEAYKMALVGKREAQLEALKAAREKLVSTCGGCARKKARWNEEIAQLERSLTREAAVQSLNTEPGTNERQPV